MKRLPAMQLCPELTSRAFVQTWRRQLEIRVLQHQVRIAAAELEHRLLQQRPAFAATARPAGPLPVNVTARDSADAR